jgi:hypothetical protein
VLGVTILPLSLTFLLNTRKTTTCDVENPDSGTGKVQAYGLNCNVFHLMLSKWKRICDGVFLLLVYIRITVGDQAIKMVGLGFN